MKRGAPGLGGGGRAGGPGRGGGLVAAAAVALAGGVGGAVWWVVRGAERGAVEAASAWAVQGEGRGVAAPAEARVAEVVRAMELVTVVLNTRVASAAEDASWRGDVRAEVRVPVRLYYGTDLGAARVEARRGTLGVVYDVVVPPPRRIAGELVTDLESAEVALGWLRFRTMSGEATLGEARRRLSESVRAMPLSPEDAARVRAETRERVERLVRLIAGEGAGVSVGFADERAGARGGRGEGG